jgi:hypothetical protein
MDKMGQKSLDRVIINVTDIDPPIILNITFPETAMMGTPVPIQVEATDGTGMRDVRIVYLDTNDEVHNESLIAHPDVFKYMIPGQSGTGLIRFYVWIQDSNHLENRSQWFDIEIMEDIIPWLTLIRPSNDVFVSRIVDIIINVSDEHSGLSYVSVNVNGIPEPEIYNTTPDSTLFTVEWDTTGIDEGDYVIMVKAEDRYGNSKVVESEVTVDNILPVVDAGPDSKTQLGERFDFDGSACSDNYKIDTYHWTFQYGENRITLIGIMPWFTFDISGEYKVTLTVTDLAGNKETDLMTLTVISPEGNITPTIAITSPKANAEYESGDFIEIIGTTTGVGEGNLVIIEIGEISKTTLVNKDGTWSITIRAPNEEGTYTLTASVEGVNPSRGTIIVKGESKEDDDSQDDDIEPPDGDEDEGLFGAIVGMSIITALLFITVIALVLFYIFAKKRKTQDEPEPEDIGAESEYEDPPDTFESTEGGPDEQSIVTEPIDDPYLDTYQSETVHAQPDTEMPSETTEPDERQLTGPEIQQAELNEVETIPEEDPIDQNGSGKVVTAPMEEIGR